uniref:Uncharacterized protein n=1 Tax=Alexandrium monilatum TaxID=311494 RepID=A0A7S4Q6U3_9DINO
MGAASSALQSICESNLTDLKEERDLEACDPPIPTSSLVFIERDGQSRDGSTTEGSFRGRGSAKQSVKDISVFQTAGVGILAVFPDKLDKAKLASFREVLHLQGINTSLWGVNGAKSVEHLFWEAYQQRGCALTGADELGMLKRVTRLLKIKLISEIYGVDHTLLSRMQFMHDGQTVQRKQVIVRKMMWLDDLENHPDWQESVTSEECPYTENWREGLHKALQERLGLPTKWQEQHLIEEKHEYSYSVEDNVKSDGYPGLNTLYCIHQVVMRVSDPEKATCLGLPHGMEFATSEGDFNFNAQHHEDGLPIGTQLNIWTWERRVPQAVEKQRTGSVMASKSDGAKATEPAPCVQKVQALWEMESRMMKRVPLVLSSEDTMAIRLRSASKNPPCGALWAALKGQKTNWALVKRMARSIADPRYSLKQFQEDLKAFPELQLYLLEDTDHTENTSAVTSSGRTRGDEFQRTVGAFFAIYWLMRLEGDGKDGFSFGVDDKWVPMKPRSSDDKRLYPTDKRINFRANGKWEYFKRLLTEAGLIERTTWGSNKPNEKRVVSLLALTAMHDIMKMDLLLPEVEAVHAPYQGYASRDRIADHDLALAYVMEHFPEMLPSFWGLDPAERHSVRFTQCNLCFNHGWFVQAEAPPGAIFTKFRKCLIRDHMSKIGSRDVALYFIHWLTDLAGAEPTPLGGCEKFVLKFPLPVLNSFLRSFEFVEKIVCHTETEVMEEYLKVRWSEHVPSPGPVPFGESAIARMRLLCMAQMNAPMVLKEYGELSDEDRLTLSTEMSLTGCIGQSYSADLIPKEVSEHPHGPAFLIYYGPAFFQNLGNDRAVRRLSVMAEVYRCARALWPASITKVACSVIVRIDTIKTLSTDDLLQVVAEDDLWLLVKHNDSEAFIERSSKKKLNKFISNGQSIQIIDLSYIKSKY